MPNKRLFRLCNRKLAHLVVQLAVILVDSSQRARAAMEVGDPHLIHQIMNEYWSRSHLPLTSEKYNSEVNHYQGITIVINISYIPDIDTKEPVLVWSKSLQCTAVEVSERVPCIISLTLVVMPLAGIIIPNSFWLHPNNTAHMSHVQDLFVENRGCTLRLMMVNQI